LAAGGLLPVSRGPRGRGRLDAEATVRYKFTKGFWVRQGRVPAMIPPLVHQRRPCYDFYFL
jgi:hypothetical protein